MLVCFSEQMHFDQASVMLDSENRVSLGSNRKCIVWSLVLPFKLLQFCESKLVMYENKNYLVLGQQQSLYCRLRYFVNVFIYYL